MTRRLIACCDGTWNRPDSYGGTTNVVKLLRAIKPLGRRRPSEPVSADNPEDVSQIVYYHPGVGTGNFVDRLMGGGTGIGLGEHVRTIYSFFVDNYLEADEIFLFGFSRGAYTARSVTGMMSHVGLLRKGDMQNLDEVWDYYRQHKLTRDEEQPGFLARFADRPDRLKGGHLPIKCIGVWDTVGALGIPNSHVCQQQYRFYDTALGPTVEHAYHALALDEERKPFMPAIWSRHPSPTVDQTLVQVWFPGVHSNVGGGYANQVLSDAALFWMCAKVFPLLDLDHRQICASAQADRPGGIYAKGRLENSRTGSWRLLGRLDRQTLCEADRSTRIHESVWTRADDGPDLPVPAPYRNAAFREFLGANVDRREALSDYERQLRGDIPRTPRENELQRHYRNRSCCDNIVGALGGFRDRPPPGRADKILKRVSFTGLALLFILQWLIGGSSWLQRFLHLPTGDDSLWIVCLGAVLSLLTVPVLIVWGAKGLLWDRGDAPPPDRAAIVGCMIVGGALRAATVVFYLSDGVRMWAQAVVYGISTATLVGIMLALYGCFADPNDRDPRPWQISRLGQVSIILMILIGESLQAGKIATNDATWLYTFLLPFVIPLVLFDWLRVNARRQPA